MKIKSLTIQNFRSYREATTIEFSNLTALIGRNDIGKSTILEAMDIFFNDGDGAIKIDKSDLNIQASAANDTDIIISACFTDLPESIIIDSTVQTSLADEYMLNSDGLLEVIKKYKNGVGKAAVFIRARHPNNPDCSNLLLKKNAELKRIIADKGIVCRNQNVNANMRKAIWAYYKDNLDLRDTEINVAKEEAKIIWDKLSAYLPLYSLFQADRKNSDEDDEVQDPLKIAVRQILSEEDIQQKLAYVAKTVEKKLREVAGRTLEKLQEMDATVANSLNPVIEPAERLKWADVFKRVYISGDDGIPISKRGSGVKRLVLLNFFRGEVERRSEEGTNTGIIYAIEEPETSQHPNNQRILIDALKRLAGFNNTQILITTHSPVIVRMLDFENLRLICNNGSKRCINHLEDAVLQFPSLDEVSYIAYGEVNEDYHNELYGYLEEHGWLKDYSTAENKKEKPRLYKRMYDGKVKECYHDLSTYIRHQIHHPENKLNEHFTNEELLKSVDNMREYIKKHKENETE